MKIAAEREDLEDLSGFQNVAVHDASELYISIGQGNRKIGLIPSWSLPQVETCNPRCLPHCWCQDGHETRIPKGAYVCGGDCPKCGFRCAFGSEDVVINLHR